MTMTYTKKRRAIAFRVVAHHKPYPQGRLHAYAQTYLKWNNALFFFRGGDFDAN